MTDSAPGYGGLLRELGGERPDMVVIDAGLGSSMMTGQFAEAFPGRYFNLGIAEQNAVSVASGLARRGFVPLVHTFSNFLARRAHDQVALSVAWPRCNVKLIGGSCGLFDGRNGPSHMAIDDLAVMAALPGMLVLEPGDEQQTGGLLRKMMAHEGPAYLRLRRHGAPRALVPPTERERGTVVLQEVEGARCTLVACGSMLSEGLLASRMLADQSLPVDVLHLSVLRPLDARPLLASAARTRWVVSVENHVACGGYGDALSRELGPLGIRHVRLCLPDEFIPAGDPAWQLAYCGLDARSLAARIASLLSGESRV